MEADPTGKESACVFVIVLFLKKNCFMWSVGGGELGMRTCVSCLCWQLLERKTQHSLSISMVSTEELSSSLRSEAAGVGCRVALSAVELRC